ncbi:hypothetical protein PSEUBRA_001363 [Kalmanozyma brasiliensis GHG001]|uniref:CFEM domain-containing protein n=1 Tax=Kalmanozyma brasiliensis (strain GHG001) TaxID=1365824 RepID=V5EYY2_KALBG|nr:uncharacterized protein PSEUBRA_001363 [Kalmanozyma brasiliensis GHG001]EST09033.1 hypothetical protein PSEUBRA_001363 [Kalmanozyma brasiliensis GHG001]
MRFTHFLLAFVIVAASAAAAPQPSDDNGSISAPSTGTDAQSIIAASAHSMGTSSDSTDDSDAKDLNPQHGEHNGQCVTACAIQSTAGVGCGNDLTKPDCFCKSESFMDQSFACINATCPQQFHGAAGVISSICSSAGVPSVKIAGYSGTDNLENMPHVSSASAAALTTSMPPGVSGSHATATSSDAPSASTSGTGTSGTGDASDGASNEGTSTYTMPSDVPTNMVPPPGSGSGNGSNGDDQPPAKAPTPAPAPNKSGAAGGRSEAMGAVALAVSVAVLAATAGAWTLF